MTVVAGKILVGGVDVEERVPFGVELAELLSAALGKDSMAGIAIAGLNSLLSIRGLVQPIVAAETARPVFVAVVHGIGPPVCLHLGKKIVAIDALSFTDKRIDPGKVRILRTQGGCYLVERLIFCRVRLDESSDDVGFHPGDGRIDSAR